MKQSLTPQPGPQPHFGDANGSRWDALSVWGWGLSLSHCSMGHPGPTPYRSEPLGAVFRLCSRPGWGYGVQRSGFTSPLHPSNPAPPRGWEDSATAINAQRSCVPQPSLPRSRILPCSSGKFPFPPSHSLFTKPLRQSRGSVLLSRCAECPDVGDPPRKPTSSPCPFPSRGWRGDGDRRPQEGFFPSAPLVPPSTLHPSPQQLPQPRGCVRRRRAPCPMSQHSHGPDLCNALGWGGTQSSPPPLELC